ncbi:hypothetical protein RDI58_003544 [Solanum bulbocastanum]|uniref:Uncharacterized protein n=1 Tax=Solanum bulbocastanum TaxID=147425 RepID=A0AAN8U8J8_SOLBU
MAAVVDACVCEITKISEKVRAKSLFLLKKKKTGDKVEESQNSSSSSLEMAESKNDNNIMCEATVFLLMDRFAPC